jgi:uncharacterized protein YcbK (DUF882 family)
MSETMTSGPSPHLSWHELACKDGTPYPEEWRATRAVVLAEAFEHVRAVVGRPLVVLSAYRTEAHNRRVGGAKHSQHVEGRALDLRPPKELTPFDFYRLIRGEVERCRIRGLSPYPTFVHIDVRPSERLVVWMGTRVWAEMV